jgi:hypothetical protein
MKSYLLKILAVALVIMATHALVMITVRAPLPAEYWIREFIIVKKYQADMLPSPKLIFSGGSCTLFGIDAAEVQKQLNLPAINLGLHASMRLEDHLALARAVAKPGDTLILSLEPAYYDTYTTTWTTWNLRNALAWNPHAIDRLSHLRRLQLYAQSSDLSISWDLLMTKLTGPFYPEDIDRRLATLAPVQDIVDRYRANRESSTTFQYDVSNLDPNGDLLHTQSDGPLFQGDTWAPTRPVTISPYAEGLLVPFLAEMKNRGVHVIFDYTPYLVYQTPGDDWKQDETKFQAEIHRIGGELLEQRDAFFYPNTLFFNSNLHLNEQGRQLRTQTLIDALRKKLNSPVTSQLPPAGQ